MSDEADKAQAATEPLLEADVAAIRNRAAKMPVGEPGECELCGEYSMRLVRGACARCRDKHKLP